MVSTPIVLESDGLALVGALHAPSDAESYGNRQGLVLCHGFPRGIGGATVCGQTYPELARRLVADTGWVVLTFNFRGTGASAGDFSLRGWMNDLRTAIEFLERRGIGGVWTGGAGTGGAVAVCHAAENERVRGVVTLGAQADFDAWAADPDGFVAHARAVGVVRDRNFPLDLKRWVAELRETRPLAAAAKLPPRPFLVIHGDADDQVPAPDARALVDTAGAGAELAIVHEAGHLLRHDPRAVAVLMGWLERQWVDPSATQTSH